MAKRKLKRSVKNKAGRKKSTPKAVRYFSDELGALIADTAEAVSGAARSKEVKDIGHKLVEDVRAAGKGLAEALESAKKSKDAKEINARTRLLVSRLKKRRGRSLVKQSAGLLEDLLELGKRAVRGVRDAAESDYVRDIPRTAVKRARAAGRRLEKAVRAARASADLIAMKKQTRKLLSVSKKEVQSAMRAAGEAVNTGIAASSGAMPGAAGFVRTAKKKARRALKRDRSTAAAVLRKLARNVAPK